MVDGCLRGNRWDLRHFFLVSKSTAGVCAQQISRAARSEPSNL